MVMESGMKEFLKWPVLFLFLAWRISLTFGGCALSALLVKLVSPACGCVCIEHLLSI
jgi:hypothetical protein